MSSFPHRSGWSRREFLARSSALACGSLFLAGASPAAHRQSEKRSPLMIIVYLRGGADFLNMVIPHKDKTYREMRPTIGIGEDDGAPSLSGTDFALHPALSPLLPLWETDQLAPIVCTGSPHSTRSHFDAQDFMERAAPGLRHVTTGWLNRYLQISTSENSSTFRALAVQGLLPRSLRGEFPALAVPPGLGRGQGQDTLDEFEELYDLGSMSNREDDVLGSGQVTIETLRQYHRILKDSETPEGVEYPNSDFGRRMRTIATLQQANCGLEVAAVDYPGWDHHIGQGGTAGRQARMLDDYSKALAALAAQLGPDLRSTLVVTMTEFGRNVAENGNSGTDHGRGGGMFLLGGGARGGRVHGKWRGLAERELIDGRDLPVTTDFRDVMGTCLRDFLDFDMPRDFFPDYSPKRLKLF